MLKKRISVLKDAGIISLEVSNYMGEVIDVLETMDFEQSKLEMFTTHLAMALKRTIEKGEELELDDSIYQEILANENFDQANSFYEQIKVGMPCAISENERKYILMHLCNLFLKV